MNRTVKTQVVKTTKVKSLQESSFCKYSHHVCMQNCMDGYDYCIHHILEDKTAPYKQCIYMTKSGRRCFMAAPKQERKDGYCSEHAKKASFARHRLSRKRRPKETVESLLEELTSVNSASSDSHNNEHRRGKLHSDSLASKALEYASSSDSDTEQPLVGQMWVDDGDSDAESIDSEQEDLLKYAGAYTTEEVAQILRDKLIKLQALYIDQFKRLKHVLLTKRQQYLKAYKSEKETLVDPEDCDLWKDKLARHVMIMTRSSIKLYKNDPSQKDKYQKLLAMKHYHRKYGKEALLQKQSTQRRMQATDGMNYLPPHFAKCVFVDEGLRCNARVVPLSKFCQKHILHDPAQVLYRPCPFADSQCGRPVPTLHNTEFCSLHQPVPFVKEHDQPDADVNVADQDGSKDYTDNRLTSVPQTSNMNILTHGTQGHPEVKMKSELSFSIKLGSATTGIAAGTMKQQVDDVEEAEKERHPQLGPLFTLGEENEEEEGIAR